MKLTVGQFNVTNPNSSGVKFTVVVGLDSRTSRKISTTVTAWPTTTVIVPPTLPATTPVYYNIAATASPNNGGSISSYGTDSRYRTLPYPAGAQVVMIATPASGYIFAGWSNDLSGTINPNTFNMISRTMNVTANFQKNATPVPPPAPPPTPPTPVPPPVPPPAPTPVYYNISATASPNNGGSISSYGTDPRYTTPPYPAGAQVVMTATPAGGYQFAGWSNDLSGTINPNTFNMIGRAMNVTANFTAVPVVPPAPITPVSLGYTKGKYFLDQGNAHGAVLGQLTTTDPAQCQQSCQSNGSCGGVTFNPAKAVCYLNKVGSYWGTSGDQNDYGWAKNGSTSQAPKSSWLANVLSSFGSLFSR